MCKQVEAALAEGAVMDTRCEVTMEGVTTVSDDFVAIISKDNGDASIFYNTDALTLGMAMKLVAKSFVEALAELNDEEKEMVNDILGDALVFNKPEEE